jgi:hypothetical protein
LAKKTQLPARFLGPSKVPVGRFEVLMNLIDSSKSFEPLKITFESSTIVLKNLINFRVTVGASVLAVEVEV